MASRNKMAAIDTKRLEVHMRFDVILTKFQEWSSKEVHRHFAVHPLAKCTKCRRSSSSLVKCLWSALTSNAKCNLSARTAKCIRSAVLKIISKCTWSAKSTNEVLYPSEVHQSAQHTKCIWSAQGANEVLNPSKVHRSAQDAKCIRSAWKCIKSAYKAP